MTIEKELERAILCHYDIEIRYVKASGESSQRVIKNADYSDEFGNKDDYIKGMCMLRNEERTFRIDRIKAIRVLPMGAWVETHVKKEIAQPVFHSPFNPVPQRKQDVKTKTAKVENVPTSDNLHFSGYDKNYDSSYQKDYTSSHPKEGCYIATMAYGDYDHPQVMILRRFRDENLRPYVLGRGFIRAYYYISPKLVRFLEGKESINRIIRNILDKFVKTISNKCENLNSKHHEHRRTQN